MRLQLALDMLDLDQASRLVEDVEDHIDIIEIGTPLLKYAGVKAIETFKDSKKPVLADLKTMDAGAYEAAFAVKAGASIVTVLGAADDQTIIGVVEEAHKQGVKAQVDLINVTNKIGRAVWAHEVGADLIGIHTGIDQQAQGQSPLVDLAEISKSVPSESISVAGGINLKTLAAVMSFKPGVIVVGGAITGANDPVTMTKAMKLMLDVR